MPNLLQWYNQINAAGGHGCLRHGRKLCCFRVLSNGKASSFFDSANAGGPPLPEPLGNTPGLREP
ncbi:MAG TPA: hypothetical protein VLN58_03110 [Verrucomicrobiae bacterium]|nr:hypothetical protein [Verrucomicrobiae bacterium]